MVEFKEEDAVAMRELQVELSYVLQRANARHMEAALAAFACLRCARILLDKYPANTRAALLEAIYPFLAGVPASDITFADPHGLLVM